MDSWTQNQENFDEFLKGSSQSFLHNDFSFKESDGGVNVDNIHAEISCDNPLDTDSNADSKQLELEDLEVKKSLRDKFNEEFEEEKVMWTDIKPAMSRNEDKILSRDSSSIWNFQSMDVTHNSSSTVVMEDFDQCDERVDYQYCHSPIRKRNK